MGSVYGCRYVGVDVGLIWAMAVRRALRKIFMLNLVGLLLPDYLVSCVLGFAFCKDLDT